MPLARCALVSNGTALRKCKTGIVTGHDPAALEKTRLIEQAYEQAEAAGLEQWNEDEAGPYQASPQPGEDWHPADRPRLLPYGYQRERKVKHLSLFRPATGLMGAKDMLSAPDAVLHPWLKEQVSQKWAEVETAHPPETLPPEAEHPVLVRWETWLGHFLRRPLPPLCLVLVSDNLAGYLTNDLVDWLFDRDILPLYTPLSDSWLNMAESVQRITVSCALSDLHPKSAQEVIDWLEQTVVGWNTKPTPFVWNGKQRQRPVWARLRRLGDSGAVILVGNFIAAGPLVKTCTRVFKLEAVQPIKSCGKLTSQVPQILGISNSAPSQRSQVDVLLSEHMDSDLGGEPASLQLSRIHGALGT